MTAANLPQITETRKRMKCENCSFFKPQIIASTKPKKVNSQDSCEGFKEKNALPRTLLAPELIRSVLSHEEERIQAKTYNRINLPRRVSRKTLGDERKGEDLTRIFSKLVGEENDRREESSPKNQEQSSVFQMIGSKSNGKEKHEDSVEKSATAKESASMDNEESKSPNKKKSNPTTKNPFELLSSQNK